MLLVEWIDNDSSTTDVLDMYEKYDEAMQSIIDWWNINGFSPKYTRILGTIEDNNEVTIDYGSHINFYRIRSVSHTQTTESFMVDNDLKELDSSDGTIKKYLSKDGKLRIYVTANQNNRINVKVITDNLGVKISHDINVKTNDRVINNWEPITYYLSTLREVFTNE